MNSVSIAETPKAGQVTPGFARIPGCSPVAARWNVSCRTMYLERDNVLRIFDGAGVRVTAVSGVLWLTEEGMPDDVVLVAGSDHVIEHPGKTVLLAHRPAWVLLQDTTKRLPRHVEVATHEAGPAVRMARPYTLRVPRHCTAIGAAIFRWLRSKAAAFPLLSTDQA